MTTAFCPYDISFLCVIPSNLSGEQPSHLCCERQLILRACYLSKLRPVKCRQIIQDFLLYPLLSKQKKTQLTMAFIGAGP